MFCRVLYILVAFGLITKIQAPKRPFFIEFQNTTCTNPIGRLKRFECAMKKEDNSRYVSNILAVLNGTLARNAEIQILIHVKSVRGRKIVKFLDVKLNICDVLDTFKSTPLLKQLYTELMRSSNLPLSCPIVGNTEYKATDFVITGELLPVYTPILKFNYTVLFYENQKIFATLHQPGATVPRSPN